jgi:hypothetical protein
VANLCSNDWGKSKVSYKSRAAAEKAARKTKSGLALRIYRCSRCFEFHLTSQEQRYKIEPIPSAAKLRRKLTEYAAQIACAQRRFEAAERKLAAEQVEAALRKQRAEAAHREEMDWIERATTRLFGKMKEKTQWQNE